jgi:hypothetical protein
MTIYLYIKTHNKTGLKYLGKTTSKDPHKYKGSGTHWKRHLKKYGYDYNTEIIRECQSKEELKEWGIYYSNLWNIVESQEWANLRPEEGDGGVMPDDIVKKALETKRKNGTMSPSTPESNIQRSKTVKQQVLNGTHNSQNQIINQRRSELQKKKVKSISIKSKEVANNRVKNGEHNFIGASLSNKRLADGTHPSQTKITCEYCKKTCSLPLYSRWHGNKCPKK